MVFGCPLFSVLANKFGLKNTLILGCLGYAPYSASLYVNNRYGTEWFVIFGGVTCGIAASALWASEGAIALGYPTVGDRGKFTGIWLGLRELGQLIGSSIQLSLNVKADKRGKVGYSTYLILIGLQCLGLPLAFLISKPEQVIRGDGTRIPDPTKGKVISKEFGKLFRLLRTKRVFLLIPILVGFNWNNSYQSIYMTNYFSVRARALGALMSGIMATIANVFWGWFLDLKCFSRPTVTKIVWFTLMTMMLGCFAWQTTNEHRYSNTSPKITLDWSSPEFGRAFAVNTLFRFLNESHYMFVYFMVGTFNNDVETLTLTVGIVRCFESVGSAVSFGIGAARVAPMVNLIVAFVMFCLCIPTTTMVVWLVPEHPDDIDPTRLSDIEDEDVPAGGEVAAVEPEKYALAAVASTVASTPKP